MSIGSLLVRRLALVAVVVVCVSVLTFVVSHVIPGDPASMLVGQRASKETVQQMRHALGLDKPLTTQYWLYIKALIHGDLGTSLRTQRPVAEDLVTYFPATLELVLVAISLAVVIGIPIGIWSASRKDSPIDHIGRGFAVLGVSTPLFWLGLMVLLVFYGKLGWLPGGGRLSPFMDPPRPITGLYLLDSLLTGRLDIFRDALAHLILPAFCLSFVHIGVFSRQVRASLLEVMGQDYIRTARANGIPYRSVVYRHALRNALIPTVTVIGLAIGDLLAGAILTETIFAWPGMGAYVVDSIVFLDFPAIMGFTVVVALGYVIINLAVDVIYIALNPQIRGVG